MKVILIEDEKDANELMSIYLKSLGFEVYSFFNLSDFLQEYKSIFPDLIIADITLPDGNFLEEYEKRDDLSYVKILVITAHRDIEYMKKAFNLGAEDFLKKPFDFQELNLRIQKIFRNKETKIEIKPGVIYDLENKIVIKNGKKIHLSKKESTLLEILLKNRTRILSADILIDYIWDDEVGMNTLNVLVKRLREKLGKDIIKNKRDLGYFIE
jgi:DNA-binding response OmpR family regulator